MISKVQCAENLWEDHQMTKFEPSLDELLSDPIAIALMKRDGLRPTDVKRQMIAARATWALRHTPCTMAAE